MKAWLAVALLVVSCGVVSRPVPEYPDSPLLVSSVVALTHEDGDPYCSGVMIPEGILTAAHCVDGEDSAYVGLYGDEEFSDGEWYWPRVFPVPVLVRDDARDLALLEWVGEGLRLRVTGDSVSRGDSVVAIGHPLGIPYVSHYGHVSRPRRGHFFMHDSGNVFGMSGGPVLNSRGEVCGITHGVYALGFFSIIPDMGIAVAPEAIREFLNG